jgi:hypothetical protein
MGRPTLLLSPITATDLRNEGFESKRSEPVAQGNTYMTLWNYWAMRPNDLASAKAGIEPFASMLKQSLGAYSPQKSLAPNSQVEILVVGGDRRYPGRPETSGTWCPHQWISGGRTAGRD